MIVITIMAILTTLAIPGYQNYTKRAHYAEVIQACAPYKIAVSQCYQDCGTLAQCRSGHFGIPKKTQQSHLVDHIEVRSQGQIHIVPKAHYGIKPSEDLILTPKIAGMSLIWDVSGGAVIAGYVHHDDSF